MSPRRFQVVLLIGRTLSIEIDTTSDTLAMAIAEYHYRTFGDQYFRSADEEIVDIYVDNAPEVVA